MINMSEGEALARCIRVIESCKTNEQLVTAQRYAELMISTKFPRGFNYISLKGLDILIELGNHINAIARRKGLSYRAPNCGTFRTQPFNAGPR